MSERYEQQWIKLREELEYLRNQGVVTIHPQLVLGYMAFIENIETAAADEPAEVDDMRMVESEIHQPAPAIPKHLTKADR